MRVRIHLPILTNSEVLMFLDGDLYHFEEGNIYFFHNGCIHSSENNHLYEDRIHLVWDMLLTEDTFQRIFLRNHLSPLLIPTEEIALSPIDQRKIDGNYAKTPKILPIERARKIQFCKTQ